MKKQLLKAFVVGRTTPELECLLGTCGIALMGSASLRRLERDVRPCRALRHADLVLLFSTPHPSPEWLRGIWLLRNLTAAMQIPLIAVVARCGSAELIRGYNLGADYILSGASSGRQLRFALSLLFSEEQENDDDNSGRRSGQEHRRSALRRLHAFAKGEKENARRKMSRTAVEQRMLQPFIPCGSGGRNRARIGSGADTTSKAGAAAAHETAARRRAA